MLINFADQTNNANHYTTPPTNAATFSVFFDALLRETSLQKRSGMARFVEGFHSFTCIPTCLSTNGMNHTCLCLPS